jgi:hypothetical protein
MNPREAPARSTRLFQITVAGLSVKRDAHVVRSRLLAEFAGVDDVLATTMPATFLVVYTGEDQIDEWFAALVDASERRSGFPGVREPRAIPARRAWSGRRSRVRPSPLSAAPQEASRSVAQSMSLPPTAA